MTQRNLFSSSNVFAFWLMGDRGSGGRGWAIIYPHGAGGPKPPHPSEVHA